MNKTIKPHTICAIDASTNSLAFALFNTEHSKFGKSLGTIGKIHFEGDDIYDKVMDAGKKAKAFLISGIICIIISVIILIYWY